MTTEQTQPKRKVPEDTEPDDMGGNVLLALRLARAQAFREAAEALPKIGKLPHHVHPGFCPICDKFYARKAALEECAAALERAAEEK